MTINGEFDFVGKGNSVRRMLASASGKVGVVIAGGEISKLMMEKAGLHLWESLELNLTGDKLVKLHCAVAAFDVKDGVMRTDALGFVNPLLTLIPLIDAGPGKDSDCRQLVRDARALPNSGNNVRQRTDP